MTVALLDKCSSEEPKLNVKDLEAYLKEVRGEREPMFIFMGSCGLHVINNAIKSGFPDKKSGWHVISFLRAVYNLLKDVPSRCSNLIRHSKSSFMPLKFSAVRRLSNASVAIRGKELLPNLKFFRKGIGEDPDHRGIL